MSELPIVAYEFTPKQNEALNRLVSSMKLLAAGILAAGAVQMGYGFFLLGSGRGGQLPQLTFSLLVISLFSGIILVVSSLFLRGSTGSFAKIVETEGTDIDHLMKALDSLANFFFTGLALAWILILSLFVVLVQVRVLL